MKKFTSLKVPPPQTFENAVARQNKKKGNLKKSPGSLNLAGELSNAARLNGMMRQTYQGKP